MRFDERIHRFTWEAAGNPYLPRRSSATSPTRCASGTWCSTACPGSATPSTTRPTWSRRCSPATPPARASDHARARARLPARAARGLQPEPEQRVPEPVGAHAPLRHGQRAHRAAPPALEVSRQRQEHLRRSSARRPRRRAGGAPAAGAPPAIADRAHHPGSPSPRAMQSTRQSTAMSTIRRARAKPSARSGGRRKSRSTQAEWAIGMRPRSAATSGAKASRAGGAAARSAARRPWISIEEAGGATSGRTSPETDRAGNDPGAVDRHRREREHLVAARVEPGGLQIDYDEPG